MLEVLTLMSVLHPAVDSMDEKRLYIIVNYTNSESYKTSKKRVLQFCLS